MEQNLTQGNVMRMLIRFAFPLLCANLLQSFYNVVDMLVVGRYLSSAGLAGVSSATSVCYVITAVCSGVTVGGSVLVARYTGSGEESARRAVVGNLFSLCLLVGLLMTVIPLLLYRPVFQLMRVPADALPHAQRYMAVVALGTPFVLGYNAISAVLRGLGDSRTPLWCIAAATVVNVVLDLLLVGPAGMGAAGAALATVVSQILSLVIGLLFLVRRKFFKDFSPQDFKLKPAYAGAILRIGLPTAVQLSVVNLSYLLATGMFNVFGTVSAAAAGIGLKISTFSAMPCWAVGTAVTTMAGQCMGANDSVRAGKTAVAGLKLAVLSYLPIILAVWLWAEPIVAFFDPSPFVIEAGAYYMRMCCSLNAIAYAAMYVFDSFATGVGHATLAMVNALLHSVVIRLALSWLLAFVLGFGFPGLCASEMMAPILPALIGTYFYLRKKWK